MIELKAVALGAEARLLRARGRHAESLATAESALALQSELSVTNTRIKRAFVEALEAAFELGDLDKAAELLGAVESLHPGKVTPFLRAQRDRFGARLDAVQGRHERVDGRFRSAEAVLREFQLVFHLAVTLLEHAEWLAAHHRSDEATTLVSEARAIFEQLEAKPWLERAARLSRAGAEPEAVPTGS